MTTIFALAGAAVALQNPRIENYVQSNFEDATFVAKKERADQRELRKINNDFGQSYRFDTITVRVKEPFKLRLEAMVEDTRALYIINGAKQYFEVPRLRVRQRTDLSKSPGRRQTLLDFGLITPSLVSDLYLAKFVRFDRASGNPVFDLTFPAGMDDTSRQRVWIDKERKYVVRREWYSQSGILRATFSYEAPITSSGISMPTRLTVRNAEDKVAGVTGYDSIRINTGLAEDLFRATN